MSQPQNVQYPYPGDQAQAPACAFRPPPDRAQYCHPAPFSQQCGQRYHNLTQAYGQSRRVRQ